MGLQLFVLLASSWVLVTRIVLICPNGIQSVVRYFRRALDIYKNQAITRQKQFVFHLGARTDVLQPKYSKYFRTEIYTTYHTKSNGLTLLFCEKARMLN